MFLQRAFERKLMRKTKNVNVNAFHSQLFVSEGVHYIDIYEWIKSFMNWKSEICIFNFGLEMYGHYSLLLILVTSIKRRSEVMYNWINWHINEMHDS